MNIMNNTVDFFSNSMAKYKSLSSNISSDLYENVLCASTIENDIYLQYIYCSLIYTKIEFQFVIKCGIKL